jgi:hypothetical protein
MMKKVSRIFLPFVLLLFVFTCFEFRVFSCRNNTGDFELVLSARSADAIQHNSCKEMEIFHEDFFQQSDVTYISQIKTISPKVHYGIFTVPLQYSHNYWHPPKLT